MIAIHLFQLSRRYQRAYLDALGKDPDDATDEDVATAKESALQALGLDRETLGRLVREEWIRWAREQPNPKGSWLVPWEGLSDPDQEVDCRIGEAILRRVVSVLDNGEGP